MPASRNLRIIELLRDFETFSFLSRPEVALKILDWNKLEGSPRPAWLAPRASLGWDWQSENGNLEGSGERLYLAQGWPTCLQLCVCRVCWVHLLVCTVAEVTGADRQMSGLEGAWWVFRGLLPHPKYIMQQQRRGSKVLAHGF